MSLCQGMDLYGCCSTLGTVALQDCEGCNCEHLLALGGVLITMSVTSGLCVLLALGTGTGEQASHCKHFSV